MPSMTITTSAENAADLAAAIGWDTGLNGSATAAQVKAWTIKQLRDVDRRHKEHVAMLALQVTPIDPT